MIDWTKAIPSDFDVTFNVEEIIETASHIQIPVQVTHRASGSVLFSRTVPIRMEFYRDLKTQPDYLSALVKIVNGRVRESVVEKINGHKMDIEDKVALIDRSGPLE